MMCCLNKDLKKEETVRICEGREFQAEQAPSENIPKLRTCLECSKSNTVSHTDAP